MKRTCCGRSSSFNVRTPRNKLILALCLSTSSAAKVHQLRRFGAPDVTANTKPAVAISASS